jgi:hypothetical protein
MLNLEDLFPPVFTIGYEMELFGIIPAFFNMFNLGTRMELK